MGERQSFRRTGVNDLGDFHEINANKLLHSKNRPEMLRRVLQNEIPNLRVESQVSLELRYQQCGQNVRVIERIVCGLVCQWLSCEGLNGSSQDIPMMDVRS